MNNYLLSINYPYASSLVIYLILYKQKIRHQNSIFRYQSGNAVFASAIFCLRARRSPARNLIDQAMAELFGRVLNDTFRHTTKKTYNQPIPHQSTTFHDMVHVHINLRLTVASYLTIMKVSCLLRPVIYFWKQSAKIALHHNLQL